MVRRLAALSAAGRCAGVAALRRDVRGAAARGAAARFVLEASGAAGKFRTRCASRPGASAWSSARRATRCLHRRAPRRAAAGLAAVGRGRSRASGASAARSTRASAGSRRSRPTPSRRAAARTCARRGGARPRTTPSRPQVPHHQAHRGHEDAAQKGGRARRDGNAGPRGGARGRRHGRRRGREARGAAPPAPSSRSGRWPTAARLRGAQRRRRARTGQGGAARRRRGASASGSGRARSPVEARARALPTAGVAGPRAAEPEEAGRAVAAPSPARRRFPRRRAADGPLTRSGKCVWTMVAGKRSRRATAAGRRASPAYAPRSTGARRPRAAAQDGGARRAAVARGVLSPSAAAKQPPPFTCRTRRSVSFSRHLLVEQGK